MEHHLKLLGLFSLVLALAGCVGYSEVKVSKPEYRPVAGQTGDAQYSIMKSMRSGSRDPLAALGGFLSEAEISSR